MFTEAHISCAVLCCSKSLLACDPRNLELKFMFDFGACRQGECIKLAQEIWKEWYGVPRDFSETVRLDTGKKRAMKEDSENFFLAKRRRRVSEDVPLLTCEEVRTATSVHVPVDCERTEKELTIQLRKQFKNTIQNYLWGHLTAAEVPANLIDVAAEFAESRSKQDMQRVKDASKKQALLDAVPPHFHRESQWIFLERAEWSQQRAFAGCKITADPLLPLFYVVSDPSSPPTSVLWAATIRGGCVLDLDCMLNIIAQRPHQKNKGVAYLYDAAYSIQRKILVCEDFAATKPEVSEIVQQCM